MCRCVNLQRTEDSIRSPGSRVVNGCESPGSPARATSAHLAVSPTFLPPQFQRVVEKFFSKPRFLATTKHPTSSPCHAEDPETLASFQRKFLLTLIPMLLAWTHRGGIAFILKACPFPLPQEKWPAMIQLKGSLPEHLSYSL